MRTCTPLVVGFIVLAVFIGGLAVGAQVQIRQQAPTDRAADFPLADIEAIVQEMDAEQRATDRLIGTVPGLPGKQ